MSNNATIKVDVRVLYGLIAVVAVLGIFGIGWWLGNQLGEPEVATAPPINEVLSGTPVVPDGPPPGDGIAPPSSRETGTGWPISIEDQPLVAGQPRLWLPEVAETNFVHDFGQIPADQAVEKDFQITNLGDTELVIEDVSASCGCTAAAVGDSTVGPGETTTVRVSYDPRHNQEFGKFVTKQVRIKSNDPLVPLAEFTIQADVAAQ